MSTPTEFCQDGIESLTIDDKINILCSKNPINEIIEIVNCKNPKHQNMLLQNPNSNSMQIYYKGKIVDIDTNIGLCLLIEIKIQDLTEIVKELVEYLDRSFVEQFLEYLNGGCNKEPLFRKRKCQPKDILNKSITLDKLKKIYKSKTTINQKNDSTNVNEK